MSRLASVLSTLANNANTTASNGQTNVQLESLLEACTFVDRFAQCDKACIIRYTERKPMRQFSSSC